MTAKVADAERCVHHWVLGVMSDQVTPGECRKCGAERIFTGGVAQGKRALSVRIPAAVETRADREFGAAEDMASAIAEAKRAVGKE